MQVMTFFDPIFLYFSESRINQINFTIFFEFHNVDCGSVIVYMNDVTKIENELEVESLNVEFDLPNNQIE